MTHDRVLRFARLFETDDLAARFATEQAFAWLGSSPAASLTIALEE